MIRHVRPALRVAAGQDEHRPRGAGLPFLLGGPDQDLIDRHVTRPGHDVGDRVRDVRGLHPLAELVPYALEHLWAVVAG